MIYNGSVGRHLEGNLRHLTCIGCKIEWTLSCTMHWLNFYIFALQCTLYKSIEFISTRCKNVHQDALTWTENAGLEWAVIGMGGNQGTLTAHMYTLSLGIQYIVFGALLNAWPFNLCFFYSGSKHIDYFGMAFHPYHINTLICHKQSWQAVGPCENKAQGTLGLSSYHKILHKSW